MGIISPISLPASISNMIGASWAFTEKQNAINNVRRMRVGRMVSLKIFNEGTYYLPSSVKFKVIVRKVDRTQYRIIHSLPGFLDKTCL